MSLSSDVRRVLLRAIKRNIANGVLQWRTPITIASSMSLSLRNRSAPFNSKKCYDRRTFRATAKFHGKAMWDCAKFAVEGFDSSVRIFFGRCLAFFRDAHGAHYIALRWFEASNGDRNVYRSYCTNASLTRGMHNRAYKLWGHASHCIIKWCPIDSKRRPFLRPSKSKRAGCLPYS
jgi:hypothetical protein